MSTTPAIKPAHDSDVQPSLTQRLSRRVAGIGLIATLAAAYGTFAAFIGRFLYPAGKAERDWMFVLEASKLGDNQAMVFRTPSGAPVNITRQAQGQIVALSSTCPHLGCQVHWEAQNNRFFCPCHNGTFDPSGVATGGPPGDAGQKLLEYPVKIDGGLLFIELPTDELALGSGRLEEPEGPEIAYSCRPRGPGQDPCLFPQSQPLERGGRLA